MAFLEYVSSQISPLQKFPFINQTPNCCDALLALLSEGSPAYSIPKEFLVKGIPTGLGYYQEEEVYSTHLDHIIIDN